MTTATDFRSERRSPAVAAGLDSEVFVGRDRELSRLDAALDRARSGALGVVFLSGEAGAGKTALVVEWAARIAASDRGVRICMGRCSAQSGAGEPYGPFRQTLGDLLQLERLVAETKDGGTPAAPSAFVRTAMMSLVKCAPDLLGVFVPGGHLMGGLVRSFANELHAAPARESRPSPDGGLQEGRLLEQYASFLRELSTHSPVVVFLDDMHWCDAASANLLLHLLRQLERSRVVLVCAFRNVPVQSGTPGSKHPLETVVSEAKRIHGEVRLDLDEVSESDRRAFADALLDAEPNRLGSEFRRRLFEHTAGHPLFTRELLHKLKDDGGLVRTEDEGWIESGRTDWDSIPPRMEGIVEGRLAELDPSLRESLSVASVQGNQFLLQVVSRVQKSDDREALVRWSGELHRRQRLVNEVRTTRRAGNMLSVFRFAAPVYQQYLYGQLGSGERMLLHGEVAAALESIFGESDPDVLFQLARHYDLACMPEKAIPFLLDAGKVSVELGAYAEARLHLERADELVRDRLESELSSRSIRTGAGRSADDPELRRIQSEILLNLGLVVRVLEGWNSPLAKELYNRVLRLGPDLGDPKAGIQARFGKWARKLTKAAFAKAMRYALEMRHLAENCPDDGPRNLADSAYGNILFWMGEFGQLSDELGPLYARLQAAYPEGSRPALLDGEFEVWALPAQFGSWLLALRGKPDEARRMCLRALERANALDQGFSQMFCRRTAAFLDLLLETPESSLEHARVLQEVACKNGLAAYAGLGKVCENWALLKTGTGGSIEGIDAGFDAWKAQAGELTITFKHLAKGDALLHLGRSAEAEEELQNGIAHAERLGELAFLGLLLERLGRHQAASGQLDASCQTLRRAREVATRQGAVLILDRIDRIEADHATAR